MDSTCRLCCSTNFVNNYLFDEENALNLKMELFLPIKVTKGDQLPQKVCNRCSCKVNDIYQFCNIAIEAQDRLRGMLLNISTNLNDSIDLTVTKRENLLPILSGTNTTDKETQTDTIISKEEIDLESPKVEPKSRSPSPIKREVCSFDSEQHDLPDSILSDDSDDLSLIALKRKKRGRNPSTNGEAPMKRGRKKKGKLKELIMNALPPMDDSDHDSLLEKPDYSLKTNVKKETDFIETQQDQKTTVKVKKTVDIKKELNETDTYQCCICLRQCYSRSATLQHYREHVSAERVERPAPPPRPAADAPRCVRCNKRVEGGWESWAEHWARHWERDAKPYRCALCEMAFRDPHQILKHGMTHKEGDDAQKSLNKRFVCDFCPEGFVYMRYLLAHRARAHPSLAARPLRLRCGQCAREFAHLNSLRRHLRAHSGERNHLCSVCGKALSSREHLKFHLRIHSGYKPNVCKTCGKGFVKKCNLTLHERVHSGEKPHVCSHCGKAFSQRSTLVIHERYHSGARPYSCALCGRGFVAKGLLSMHLKSTCI